MTRLEQLRVLNEQRFEDPGAIGNAFDDAMADLLAVAEAARDLLSVKPMRLPASNLAVLSFADELYALHAALAPLLEEADQ